MHVCTCQREAPNIRNAKEEGVPHLPHTEIFRKWRENEEHDLHDANKYPDQSVSLIFLRIQATPWSRMES